MGRPGLMVLCSLVFGSSLGACGNRPEPAPQAPGSLAVSINVAPKQAVDVLFLIDNSNSMESMQEYLRQSFYEFFKPFDELSARGTFLDFHIGVVSSDFGAGATGGPGCTPNGYPNGGGDQGKLIPLGKKAAPDCLPPDGERYIRFTYGPGGEAKSNLPHGQGLPETFTCMASLGANGCGYEHQLESVYRALSGEVTENQGFLRDEAVLAVVLLSNEDDASAPPDTDVFDKNKVPQYGYLDSYSRQTRFAIQCGEPADFPPYGDSGGVLEECHPAPNLLGKGPGLQYDVKRYIDFFTQPRTLGGVKDDPTDVILYAIDAPETPFQVILSNPGTPGGQPLVACGQLNEASNPPCVPVLKHSCMNTRNPNLFGDPAVRINTVVKSVQNHKLWSICDDNYPEAMHQLANLTAQAALGVGCLPEEVVGPAGAVDCRVSDVTDDVDHESATDLPRCSSDGPRPCWYVTAKPLCEGRSTAGLGLSVDRNGAPPPQGTHPRASCQPVR